MQDHRPGGGVEPPSRLPQTMRLLGIHRTDIDCAFDKHIPGFRAFVWRSLAIIGIGGITIALAGTFIESLSESIESVARYGADVVAPLFSAPKILVKKYGLTRRSDAAFLTVVVFFILRFCHGDPVSRIVILCWENSAFFIY